MPRTWGLADRMPDRSCPAADVRDMSKLTEIIGIDSSLHDALRTGGHRPVKEGILLGIRGPKFPGRLLVQILETDLAGAHAVQQVSPRLPDVGTADMGGPVADRHRRVRSKAFSHRCQRKRLVFALVKNAHGSQCTQQAIERSRM